MTPKEARDPKNLTKVKNNLENNRIKNRKYPEVKVGDKVRIYKNVRISKNLTFLFGQKIDMKLRKLKMFQMLENYIM
jgi:ribosomal protein S17